MSNPRKDSNFCEKSTISVTAHLKKSNQDLPIHKHLFLNIAEIILKYFLRL